MFYEIVSTGAFNYIHIFGALKPESTGKLKKKNGLWRLQVKFRKLTGDYNTDIFGIIDFKSISVWFLLR